MSSRSEAAESALAHAFVRALVKTHCLAVRDGASRVIAAAREAPAGAARLDPEAIHDYRVALRRLRTLLRAAAPLFKRKAMARLKEGLQAFARTAGDVRDEEVLAETLGGIALPPATRARIDAWLRTRARRERELRAKVIAELGPAGDRGAEGEPAIADEPTAMDGSNAASSGAEASRSPDPGQCAEEAPGGTASPRDLKMSLSHALTLARELPLRRRADHVSARALAFQAMQKAGGRTLEAGRRGRGTPQALHALRIRWKGVRYTAELLSPAIARTGPAAEAIAGLVKAATRMQKRLGDIHDVDEAIAAVTRARSLGAGDRMVVHHRLRAEREHLCARLAKELPGALALLQSGDGPARLE